MINKKLFSSVSLVLHHASFFIQSETQNATYVIFLRNNDDLYMLE